MRNNEGIDILASNPVTKRNISIQVKTTQNKRRWPLNKKVEIPISNLYFIFVNIISDIQQEYFIISSKKLAKLIKENHQKWLNSPNKKGEKHNQTDMREFSDKDGIYLEKWELLEFD